LNVKSVKTIGQDEEIVLDVVCDQTVGVLSMHSEYMVDKGYQFNVIMSKGGEVKGSLLIGPDNTDAVFNLETSKEKLLQFMSLGLEHIYTGYDHMLFVLALILVSPKIWPLVKTVTAFTVAHTLTLALSTLNILSVSPRFVEPMIAFSIAFVAFGDLWNSYRRNKQPSLHSHPKYWLIAFGFGLVHGLAFAGGLKEIKIPQSLLIPSLLSFNAGVELAQVSIIAVVFPVLCFLKSFKWQPRFVQAVLLLVGSLGSVWLVQRVYVLFT
jgi:hydrogenase/urease accessory protein HupE